VFLNPEQYRDRLFRFQKHQIDRSAVVSLAPRIAPLEPPFTEEIDRQLRSMMPPGVAPIALFRTFAHNLPMARAMGGWGRYELSKELSLTLRQRELVIDRTCARCGCEYEWGVHVAFFAERVGLSGEQIASLTHGSPADRCWTDPGEQVLIEAVDELHDGHDLTDRLWARLAGHFTDAQVLDLTLLAGWYHAISYAARAARVPLEAGAPRFADARPPVIDRSSASASVPEAS
jgi:alkylhydroperoxidase family enzyme